VTGSRPLRTRAVRAALAAVAVVLVAAVPAAAQVVEGAGVEVDFEVGGFDPTAGDFTVDAVVVTAADLDVGELFVIELQTAAGFVLWAGQADWDGGPMRFDLDRLVMVGDVEVVVVGQRTPPISVQTLAPTTTPRTSAAPTTVELTTTTGGPTSTTAAPTTSAPPTTPPSPSPPTAQILSATAGGGSGGGTVTVSVILAIIVLALVFRLPMFAGATPRWRK
jgi:hypothetical protein